MRDDHQSEIWQIFAAETTARPEELEAIRRNLSERFGDERVAQALLRHLPAARPAELHALRDRLASRRQAVSWSWWWALPAIGGGGLAATGFAAAATLLASAWWFSTQEPVLEAPIAMSISAPASGTLAVVPAPGVRLQTAGEGTVGGSPLAPVVSWTAGRFTAEVAPGQGIDLTVETREAKVRVVGTVFDVSRDALGTEVSVARGAVEVACVATPGAPPHKLTVGDRVSCWPTTGPGLLGRANALKTRGEDPNAILATVSVGLPLATGPFHAELRALEAEALLALGRPGEARASADRYLAEGGPRRAELLEIGGRAALTIGGCAAALPYLHALEALGAGNPQWLLECEGE